MTSTVASKADEYRHYAEDCWKSVNDARDLETKAVFQLTAEAWIMLASQAEALETAHRSEVIAAPPLLQSAA
jgi:hypothetical protein